ncbi:hypothetical protein KJ819_01910 [Patescibacteria group bacterium]|nr:hypothetical protein [Patescibacteria group bacterium]MBU1500961.1 hypothetical protein [Patescibacteria group bacterium]MBU2080591.1 hypothetical protein [Patescibacteria group bacterium]MBU2124334.1 hypothetical protein [Patescibacteria group bacterium]MBU2194460.1 hypothetical protein [Patescibacteria group bacterium]
MDYSQKRLLGGALHNKKNKRLQKYAFLTGVMSMLISLVHLIVTAIK